MKLSEAIEQLGDQRSIGVAKNHAREKGLDWDSGVKHVFGAILRHNDLIPAFEKRSDHAEDLIKVWIDRYKTSYDHRISVVRSQQPRTIADPIIDIIINSRLPDLGQASLEEIKFAHRLSMSAENILGQLLEEFLAEKLFQFSWHCAWGNSIRAVDFCSQDGGLLQIKNRSNSENSSSSRVRIGTDIEKWFRVNATNGSYEWGKLNRRFNTNIFTEDSFREFVLRTLQHNPDALPVEQNNPWLRRQ